MPCRILCMHMYLLTSVSGIAPEGIAPMSDQILRLHPRLRAKVSGVKYLP